MNSENSDSNRIIVGLSGGVDSAVSARLLIEQGYDVEALFMKNWEEDDTSDYCSADIDLEDAQDVCDKLDIKLHTRNFSAEYWDRVFEYFLAEYRVGRTPNPDVLCNKEIKFKAFLEHALGLGASRIATGHYARILKRGSVYELHRGVDLNKDQSYFLYTLGQEPLSRSLFPLGEISKPEVRKIATKAGFNNHAKKDSTGICFIGERRMRDFLSRYLPARTGEIKTPEGALIGEHQGLMYYTLGQRKGLGIGGHKKFGEAPWYVAGKDLKNNILIVTQGHDDSYLQSNSLVAAQMDWVSGEPPNTELVCTAKTRYRQPDQTCTLYKLDAQNYRVSFVEPQRAVTPGQSVVFYHGDQCLGGGIIESTDAKLGVLTAS